jgi:hypothetical protein
MKYITFTFLLIYICNSTYANENIAKVIEVSGNAYIISNHNVKEIKKGSKVSELDFFMCVGKSVLKIKFINKSVFVAKNNILYQASNNLNSFTKTKKSYSLTTPSHISGVKSGPNLFNNVFFVNSGNLIHSIYPPQK